VKRLAFAFLLFIGALGVAQTGHAHEMGTSAFILHESSQGTGQFVFKRTVGSDDKIPPIDFQFLPACELRHVSTEWEGNTELIQRGEFFCSRSLGEHEITASGFTRLAPDLIVLATPLQSDRIHAVLTPKQASIALGKQTASTPTLEYFLIGIEHIVFGPDHVLFVAGLYLLWKRRKQNTKQLIGQFTLFTVGHSLTLGLLVLGLIAVPTRAIEAWIALSVLWLAWELVRTEPPRQSSWPHLLLIAVFGLLHGSGFALSMEERGFPQDALLSTLLLFNLGIEVGQLWIVTVLATAFTLLEKANLPNYARLAQYALTLCVGGAALYWTLERIHSYV
jgi:hydrogenase/urease accessory protein HupE